VETLRSGELARQAGVNVETLRYYERKGLLAVPPRQQSGQRSYPPETVDLIRFIKRAQALGLSLKEVRELLELGVEADAESEPVRELLEAKLSEVEGKLRDLLGRCDGCGAVGSCPILHFLKHLEDPESAC